MFNKHSIFNRLIIYNLPISIIPFLLVLLMVYFLTCMNFKNEERLTIQSNMDTYVQNINLEKNNALQKSDYITNSSNMIEYLEEKPNQLRMQLILGQQIDSFIEIINNNSSLDLIMIYSANTSLPKGRFINRLTDLDNLYKVRLNLEKQSYIYFEKDIYTDELGNQYFILYRQMFLEEETILQIKAYIPPSHEFTIQKNDPEFLDKGKYVSVPLTDELIITAPLNTADLNLQYLRTGLLFILIGIAFSIIIFYASVVINRKTTNAINTFILELAGSDLLNTDIFENSPDDLELNIIKKAINKLIVKVNDVKDEQYKTELEKRRLKLDLLQSKINPHILYNSLSTISHNAYKNNDMETFDVIENLVSYYRLVLAQGKEFTTISEEIDMLNKYVSVNEISHSQKYNFTANVSPELENQKILHLIVQPFIENAIVHGLAGRHKENVIRLDCTYEEGFLIFRIFDNGYGISREYLSKLKNTVEVPDGVQKGYGIINTLERIRLYYGEEADISFESNENEFTEVTIKIPYKLNEI